jgi:uncharacterized protein YjbJ (UPF0337 family)
MNCRWHAAVNLDGLAPVLAGRTIVIVEMTRSWVTRMTEPFHALASCNKLDLARKENPMDKDRIQGSAKEMKGTIKEVAGKATGDAKLQADGKADKTAGKIQNAVGGVKDALRGK